MSPLARLTDPETSVEAAASVKELTRKQQRVLDALGRKSLTDERLVEIYSYCSEQWPYLFPKQSESGLRTRRAELVALGKVEFAGEWGVTEGGRRSRKWRVKQ